MKILTILMTVAGFILINTAASFSQTNQNELFTVDFQKGQVLRYKFVTQRDVFTEWKSKSDKSPGSSKTDKAVEGVELIMAYEPVQVDKFGLTTIKATCESVKVTRTDSKSTQPDAVMSINGKSYTFTVDARGKMIDKSQLDVLIKELGKEAFRKGGTSRIKEPDMIPDVVATQWFLWNSISSIKKPTNGVAIGQSWDSQLSLPTPMIMRKARDVKYTLKQVKPSQLGKIAEIDSTYKLAETITADLPIAYTGSFMMSGKFGLLSNYVIQSLEGQGQEFYNIDKGRIEKAQQNFKMAVSASFPISLDVSIDIKTDQKISMELLKDQGTDGK